MAIKTDIVSALKTAIRSSESVSCPYPDFTNPENWERYTDHSFNDFQDGEVVLAAWERGARCFGWTFCIVETDTKRLTRIGGYFDMRLVQGNKWSDYYIYRYVGGAEDETEILCPDLEDLL